MLSYERLYTALYNDFVEHKVVWDALFSCVENRVFAERSSGILGTLATIYRQRVELEKCMAVMKVYQQVLWRYREMASEANTPDDIRCCRDLMFRYRNIDFNLCMMKNDIDNAATNLRELCRCVSWSVPVFSCAQQPSVIFLHRKYGSLDRLVQVCTQPAGTLPLTEVGFNVRSHGQVRARRGQASRGYGVLHHDAAVSGRGLDATWPVACCR